MLMVPEEKRLYPRVKANLRINLLNSVCADSLDLSEGGLSFNCAEAVLNPTLWLGISFPGRDLEFRVEARLIWKKDLEAGASYGFEFMGLYETQRQELRKELVWIQIKPLLDQIEGVAIKEDITRFFLKDILEYLNRILKFVGRISEAGISLSDPEKELERMNNEILLKGYCLEELIDNKFLVSKIKEAFRALVGIWAYKGNILKLAFQKSRGHPVDYSMMEALYSNHSSSGGVGYYFDKYFLSSPCAVAVRSRKDMLREMIRKNIRQSPLDVTRICSVASGSAREIRELSPDTFEGKKVVFTCLDWDQGALEFASQAVNNFPVNVRFNFIKSDIIGTIKNNNFLGSFERQDVIYSMGLIDYLPDNMLKAFVFFFYSLLKKNGKLILTHKNKDKNFSPLAPAWFCDWRFVPRDRGEAAAIFYNCGIKEFSLFTESDEFGDIFYFTIIKHSEI